MELKNSKRSNLIVVEKIYKSMIGEPFCTWNENYPTIEDIEFDHIHNNLFVLEENKEIIGSVSIEQIEPKILEFLKRQTGKEYANQYACEISRVVIKKEFQGKGLAKTMIKKLGKFLLERNYKNAIVSVSKTNIPAIKTYSKIGFEKIGELKMHLIDFYIYMAKTSNIIHN